MFYKNFRFIGENVFNIPRKFHRNVSTASKITAVTIFYSVFQNYAENGQSPITIYEL